MALLMNFIKTRIRITELKVICFTKVGCQVNKTATLSPIFSRLTDRERTCEYAVRESSSKSINPQDENENKIPNKPRRFLLSDQKSKLKQVVKDYGATAVIFHVGISLISLGGFYGLVYSGVDVAFLLTKLCFAENVVNNKIAVGGSTFVIAYAVHKLFAPVRIAITLSATPILVHYLRQTGLLTTQPKRK